MFFFLIPFEVIGLVVLLATLAVLFEPFRTTTWVFSADEVKRRTSWFGVGWTKSWSVPGPLRLLIRVSPRQASRPSSANQGSRWELVFINQDNVELCVIKGLTNGEAEWMKTTLQQQWKPAM